jgi:membrane protease YdiL (CAAX protease family)
MGWRRSDVTLRAIARMFAVAFGLNVFGKFVLAPAAWALTGQQHDLSSFDYLRGDWWAVLRMLGYVWAIVATCEEVIFRGFILQYLIDVGGERARSLVVVVAIVVSNALFGLMHSYQGLPGILLTGTLGAIFAGIYLRCGRALLPVALVHGCFDTVSLVAIATNLDRAIRPVQESISRALGG